MNRSMLVAAFASSSTSGMLVVAAIVLLATQAAQAALVASISQNIGSPGGSFGTYGIVSSMNFSLNYDANTFGPDAALYAPRALTAADVGQSFDMTGADPSVFFGLLTDGADETLSAAGDTGFSTVSTHTNESVWFSSNSNLTGPDLAGFDVDRVELVLNSLSFDSPGSNPEGDGNWTDVNYGVTYNFYAPEPASAALLAWAGGIADSTPAEAHLMKS